MTVRIESAAVLLLLFSSARAAQAQPVNLTLDDAERTALRNHPRIAAAAFRAQAAEAAVKQVRAAYQPLMTGNLTSVGAERDTSISAGSLQTSGLASRAASGLGFSQLLLDFGRTSNLADASRLRAGAEGRDVDTFRSLVLLQVNQAYFGVLAADAVLKVAGARLNMQRLTLRQVRTLAESHLRSTLDVSFAEVAVSEAELALYQAENNLKAQNALLSAAMGDEKQTPFVLADVPLPDRVPDDPDVLVRQALKDRPELSVARLNHSAAVRFAEAEKKLRYPSVSAVGVLGVAPIRQKDFAERYSAIGLNISIPFLNGGAYAARRTEAEMRARASERDTDTLAIQVAANVRVAWAEAETSWRRLDVTARFADQANTALRLAKARYDIGLSGILELTQAQLAQTSAQIAVAGAKYDYLTRVANLQFATGALR